MLQYLQILKPIDNRTKSKYSVVLNELDYFDAVYEASKYLHLDIEMDDSTEDSYMDSIRAMEEALFRNGWMVETISNYKHEDQTPVLSQSNN